MLHLCRHDLVELLIVLIVVAAWGYEHEYVCASNIYRRPGDRRRTMLQYHMNAQRQLSLPEIAVSVPFWEMKRVYYLRFYSVSCLYDRRDQVSQSLPLSESQVRSFY